MAAAQRETASGPAGRGRVLVGLMLTTSLAAMDTTIVATAIPAIVRDLGGFALFTWVFSIYVLVQAVTIPIDGKLADLYGRKPVLIVGTLVFLCGSVLCGVAWSMPILIAFRALQGIGAGAIQATTTTVAGDLFTIEERGRVQGWLSSVWGIAAVVGPAIGGFLAEYASWRWIFYINVPIGAAALIMIGTSLHEQVTRRRHRIDLAGAVLLVVGAGALIFGLLEGGVDWPWLSAPSVGVFALSLVALLAFTWQERRAAEPMLPPWVFGRRLLVGANAAAATIGLLVIGLTTFLPTYAQEVLGTGAVVAGFVLGAMSISWPISSAFSARFYLRIGFRDTALVGAAICLASAAGFVLLPSSASVWPVAVASFVMGAGLGLLSTAIIVGIQSVVGWERRGVITGANMFTRYLGQAIGAAVFGSIANATLARQLRHAPAALQGQLPTSVNAASDVLDGADRVSPAVAAYVRHGLYLATHNVFLALLLIAIAGLLILAATPRHFAKLEFGEERTPTKAPAEPVAARGGRR